MEHELTKMFNDARAQHFRPIRWEMTPYYFQVIKAALGLPEPTNSTRSDIAAPHVQNALFGLPIVIVAPDRPDVTLVSVERSRAHD